MRLSCSLSLKALLAVVTTATLLLAGGAQGEEKAPVSGQQGEGIHQHPLVLLTPQDGACIPKSDGIMVGFAMTTATYDRSSAESGKFVVRINGEEVSRSGVNHHNFDVMLPSLLDGEYRVRVEIEVGAEGIVLVSSEVGLLVDAAGGCQDGQGQEDDYSVGGGSGEFWNDAVQQEEDGRGSSQPQQSSNQFGQRSLDTPPPPPPPPPPPRSSRPSSSSSTEEKEESKTNGKGGDEVGVSGGLPRGEPPSSPSCKAAAQLPGVCNAALLKRSMQSSTEENHPADNAINGRTGISTGDDPEGAARTRAEKSPWWMVDLGEEYILANIQISRELLVVERRRDATIPAEDYPQVQRYIDAPELHVSAYSSGGAVAWRGVVRPWEDGASFDLTSVSGVHPKEGEGGARGGIRFIKVSGVCGDTNSSSSECVLRISEFQAISHSCWDCTLHCVHGQCDGSGACRCESDWFGYDCSQRMMTSHSYLPALGPLSQWDAGAWFEPRLFDRAMDLIYLNQNPSDCSFAKAFHYPHAGLASTLHAMSGLISLGIKHNFTAIHTLSVPWEYTRDHPRCPTRDFSCYFSKWSNCSGSARAGADYHVPEHVVDYFLHVPRPFRRKGVFWWRMATLAYVLRLSDSTSMLMDVDRVKAEINYTNPIIGVHVRRGDSCHTTSRRGKCVSIDEHVRHVEGMSRRYGISKAFLATDDPEAYNILKERLPHIDFVTLESFDRTKLQSGDQVWLEHRIGRGEVPARDLAMFTLTDMLLLAEADAFVGHFASNLSRMSYMLSVLAERHVASPGGREQSRKRGTFMPFVSVDGPWCYHWRMCCDLSSQWPHSLVC